METLAVTKYESGDLTKDFRILPNHDHIQSLIDDDANESTIKITKRLFDNVESGRGSAKMEFDIPKVQRTLVIQKLTKWANLYGYKCNVDGKNISIWLKNIKRSRVEVCEKCGKRDISATRFLLGLGTIACTVAVTVGFWHWVAEHPATYVISGIVGFIICTICGSISSEYKNDR